jgi:DNA-binding SARP family transcriptional activator/tetratricopeptide (TPR) repeat protein
MGISFRILGPPEIIAGERSRVALAPRHWRVLANLLLRPNMPVPADVLAAEVWGEDPAEQAHGTVRSYVSKIGKALAQAAESDVRIVRQEHGYVLRIDPQAVDLHRFRALRRQAAAVADSGDHRHAALLLREASALWRGPALAGLSGDRISRVRDSLDEERRAASIQRIEAELHLGRHAELLGDLRLLSEQYPFDEKITEYRMTALYRSSRQADALRVYRESRARLAEEGLQPGRVLAEHHQRILRHDPGLAITPVYRSTTQASQPDTLPPGLNDFTGREEEIRLLTSEVEHRPGPLLQVIDGMAGTGKTSLAVHVARHIAGRFPDATLYLDFHAHGPGQQGLGAADALHRLLRMLDVSAERIPATLAGRRELWRSELAHRRALVVLDDVSGPEEILPIVPALGDCLILITSRRRHADWAGTRPMTLDVLTYDDAITLFTRVAGPGAAADVNELARAVRLCGYLPLAIRVTASRLRDRRAAGLSELLDELSDAQADSDRTTVEVTERVLSAFEFSYRGLTTADRRFFRYLGISPCPDTSVCAAMALAEGTFADAEAALSALRDHHLLRQSLPGRFRFHDLVRAFAMSRFRQEESELEGHRAVGRLLDYYLHAAEHAGWLLSAPSHQADSPGSPPCPEPAMRTPQAARAWLESEWSNIIHLAQYATRHERKWQCADLTHSIAEFLDTSGYWHHAFSAQMIALQACKDLDDPPGIARAAFDLSLTSLRIGKHEAALQQATDAMAIFRMLADLRGEAAAVDRLGVIHRYSARFRDALAHHQEAMDMHRRIGDDLGIARDVGNMGIAYTALGDYTGAIECMNQALSIYRRLGDRRGEARTLMNICATQGDQGYHRDALENFQESLNVFQEIGGHRQQVSLLRHNRGEIYRYKGQHGKALSEYHEALAGYRELGDLQHQSKILSDIGSAHQGMERYSEALVHHEKAESMANEIGDGYGRVKALCGMADAHRGAGSYVDALERYGEACRLAREIEAPYMEAKALYGTAETLLRTEGLGAARIYWREAREIFSRIGAPEAAFLEIRLDPLVASGS